MPEPVRIDAFLERRSLRSIAPCGSNSGSVGCSQIRIRFGGPDECEVHPPAPAIDWQYIIPKTLEHIKRNAAEKTPFCVYVGYSQMHPPFIADPDFADKSTQRGGLYADLIGEIDYRVGKILDATKEASIEDNTIVILSSDIASGGAIPQVGRSTNGPWRGDFMNTPFERSMRAPAMIRWPGKVPAGVVTNEMLAAVDWLPTLAGMVGASKLVPRDRPIDGVDASSASRLNPLLFVTVVSLQ